MSNEPKESSILNLDFISKARLFPHLVRTSFHRYKVKILTFEARSYHPIVALVSIPKIKYTKGKLDDRPKPTESDEYEDILHVYRPDGLHSSDPRLNLSISLTSIAKDLTKLGHMDFPYRIIYRKPDSNLPDFKDFHTEEEAYDFLLTVEDATRPFKII